MIGFFDHNDTITCLGQVLGCDSTPAATTDDYNVGFESFDSIAGGKLKKLVVKALCWLAINWNSGKADYLIRSRTVDEPLTF
jgi:hypothetical protein